MNYNECPECDGAIMKCIDDECKVQECPRCGFRKEVIK